VERPRTHEIGEEGELFFESMLPRPWVKRRQQPDYSIDYLVEIAEQGDLTGREFAAQVKGTERIRILGGTVRFSLKVKDIIYYIDKRIQPVYLVVLDVTNRSGYYLFLQKYVLEDLKGTNWRRKKTLTVRILEKNLLTNTNRFLVDLGHALKFMADLRPGTIQSAVAAEKRRIESLDPRFEVDITFQNGNLHAHLRAKENIVGQLLLRGQKDDILRKAGILLGQGLPVDFRPGEVDIEGSVLLRHAFSRGGRLQISRQHEGTLSVIVSDRQGREIRSIRGMRCTMEGGTQELRMAARLEGCPLEFRLRFPIPTAVPSEHSPFEWQFQFHHEMWVGKTILDVGYLEESAAIAAALKGEAQLRFEIHGLGDRLILPVGTDHIPRDVEDMHAVLADLSKARAVALRLGVAPVLKQEYKEHEFRDIGLLYRLITEEEARWPIPDKKVSLGLRPNDIPGFVQAMRKVGPIESFSIDVQSKTFNLLGDVVDIGPCRMSINEARLLSKLEELDAQAKQLSTDSIQVVWIGTERSEWVMKRILSQTSVAARDK